ncbi:hypothetical protein HOY82DRAFT_619928 [Tuber indicum]|nr:hypothetical protein HOY82DRAFT_619928 [Tuber indicum]
MVKGKAAGVPPRSEDGNQDMLEQLHARMNTALQYPNCSYHDFIHGTFNKDVAGKADIDGQSYRHFICHPNICCGQSFSVTDFIKLCDNSRFSRSGYSYPATQASGPSATVPIRSSVNTPYPESDFAFHGVTNLFEWISDGDPINSLH